MAKRFAIELREMRLARSMGSKREGNRRRSTDETHAGTREQGQTRQTQIDSLARLDLNS